MTTLASRPRAAVITETVRRKLLVSLIADLSDQSIEGLNGGQMWELMRRLPPPFLDARLAAEMSSCDTASLKALLYRVRRNCRRHFRQ
jgi:hypothetical protein